MNTLLEGPGRMAWHTDLRLVFRAFGGRQREFNWLLTDVELNCDVAGLPLSDDPHSKDAVWLSGAALTELVEAQEVQFVWGVLSGFHPETAIDVTRVDPYPYADGNDALWRPGVRIQHPLAEVEIVCWDSSSTLLMSHDDDLTRRFRSFFTEAVDLDEYNRRASVKDHKAAT